MRSSSIIRFIATSVCVLLVGCGGSESKADPAEFLVELDEAVTVYAAELDAVDDDYMAREWEVPENAEARAAWSRDLGVAALDDYLTRWDGYISALGELPLPAGFDGADPSYASGFPEYFRGTVIQAEKNARDATREYREAWENISDPLALQLRTTLPEAELNRFLAADSEMQTALDDLDEEWSRLQESLGAVDEPVDPIVDVRELSSMDQLVRRLGLLLEEIVLAG